MRTVSRRKRCRDAKQKQESSHERQTLTGTYIRRIWSWSEPSKEVETWRSHKDSGWSRVNTKGIRQDGEIKSLWLVTLGHFARVPEEKWARPGRALYLQQQPSWWPLQARGRKLSPSTGAECSQNVGSLAANSPPSLTGEGLPIAISL